VSVAAILKKLAPDRKSSGDNEVIVAVLSGGNMDLASLPRLRALAGEREEVPSPPGPQRRSYGA
jgi:threonine dehydratase